MKRIALLLTFCYLVLLLVVGADIAFAGVGADKLSPCGMVVYSKSVDPATTTEPAKYDLFMKKIPGGQPKRLTVDSDGTTGGKVSNPLFAPDGRRVLFTVELGLGYYKGEPYFRQRVWLLDVGTKKLRRLTGQEEMFLDRQWSPSGKYVALVALYPETTLSVIDLTTGKRRTIAKSPTSNWHISWSSDSRRLFYYVDEPKSRLRRGEARALAFFNQEDFSLMCSPDGARIAYVEESSFASQRDALV